MRNFNIDFLRYHKTVIGISLMTIIAALTLVFTKGLNYGVEFTGGQVIEFESEKSIDLTRVNDALKKQQFNVSTVQLVGDSRHILIRLQDQDKSQANVILTELNKIDGNIKITKAEFVGPSIGEELRQDGIISFIAALAIIFVYLSLRFNMKMSISSIVSLLHDACVILLIFVLTGLRFDIGVFASLLAIIGYSLNDSIVVFDRVRTNFTLLPNKTPYQVFSISINQMLIRTILTSGVTLFAVGSMILFGGETLYNFAIALLIGVITGTYSTIYISCGLSIIFRVDPIQDNKSESNDDNDYYKNKLKEQEA